MGYVHPQASPSAWVRKPDIAPEVDLEVTIAQRRGRPVSVGIKVLLPSIAASDRRDSGRLRTCPEPD